MIRKLTLETINEFATEVHRNAVDHGWWKEEIKLPEIISLIHSEISECWRNTEKGDKQLKFILATTESRKEYRLSWRMRLFAFLTIAAMPEVTSKRLFCRSTNTTKADRTDTVARSVKRLRAGADYLFHIERNFSI